MKENRFLYTVRFIACLAVITIHTRFPGYFGQLLDALARFAVPYFFAISGRFLLATNEGGTKYIRSRTCRALGKTLKVTGLVYLIYLAFSFAVYMIYQNTVYDWFSSKFNPAETFNFILFNSGKFIYDWTYTFDHMWYLFALIYVYGLIYIFAPVLRSWYKGLIGILLFFLFFGQLLQTYYPIRPFGINICTWFVMRNWLFVGIPFVLIGVLFADFIRDKVDTLDEEKKNRWIKSARVKAFLLLGAGVVLTAVEMQILGKKEVYMGSVCIVVSILILSECLDMGGKVLWKIGRDASSNIYYYHVLVIAIIDHLANAGIIAAMPMYAKPIVVMAICVILFYFVPAIFRKRLKMPSSV
ncbi:acyltransferase family protein [Butyrivibrio sp. XBB1001]|uniref:acyltransferase family protein n=1 Tax=Butyrivibrio sp. XBB1001 TaxID=1280682 RepID=UPI0004794354|nr:acyltransferase family protein [Butyrivibrio sp. XBB1001]